MQPVKALIGFSRGDLEPGGLNEIRPGMVISEKLGRILDKMTGFK